jgi:hypothetical protein
LTIILPTFNTEQNPGYMESYIITLGTYLILMLFFKVFFAVAGKE